MDSQLEIFIGRNVSQSLVSLTSLIVSYNNVVSVCSDQVDQVRTYMKIVSFTVTQTLA